LANYAFGELDPDEIRKRFRPNTRLVIVNHASNVIGTIQPIREIGRYCREAGIPFAIDASQSAGKIPIDIDEQFLDVVAFTGHKSCSAPPGSAYSTAGQPCWTPCLRTRAAAI
jgi:selenocysteine lyase/cysteine desulfurase